ncbi:hypothetical protein PISMIDRAFT_683764, partial [Pisolithus microcarpus 441]
MCHISCGLCRRTKILAKSHPHSTDPMVYRATTYPIPIRLREEVYKMICISHTM